MKQGKTEKAVFAKLSTEKVELQEWQRQILEVELGQDVNLSSVKELNNYIKVFKKNNAALSKVANKINTAIKKYNSASSDLQSLSRQANGIVSDLSGDEYRAVEAMRDFRDNASELGLSFNNVPEYKELMDLINDQSILQIKRAVDELLRVSIEDINPLP